MKQMLKKTAVITGAAGFIGSHLCERLIQEGLRVIAVDNYLTGSPANIKHLLREKNFRFIRKDITLGLEVKGRVDFLLHFASPASPEDYLKFPIPTLRVGSEGTRHALELAREKKSVFVLASTSEVYGDPLEHPQTESYWGNVNPVGARSCYDEAKRFAEALTVAYQRVHRLKARIARIFNTYGPRIRAKDGRVVPNFIYQALHNLPLTIYGTGTQTRSFCYVSDLVEGILRLARSGIEGPVNLGNPREFTILELAELTQKIIGKKSQVIYKPLPQDDPRQRRPDISKAKKLLGWEPKIKVEDGLQSTINWFSSVPLP